ncbi:MAG: hypothetical protein WCH83_04715 [Alphaproteobacteria bacterium]
MSIRTFALAAVAATGLVTALPTSQAQAAYFPWGPLAAGVAIGATTAVIASSAARAAPAPVYGGDCYRVRRWVETPYGMVRRSMVVCD